MTNPFEVKDKVVLVTGGTRGLGRAISLHLANHGAQVLAAYFQNESAAGRFMKEATEQGLRCDVIRANLMSAPGVQSLADQVIERHKCVDVLIHNAATGIHKPLTELSQRHLNAVWQVNVGSFLDLALRLKPKMPVGSRIIAISSEGARKAVKHYGSIGSSKAALEGLCRQMAVEWARQGIHVNLVAPGLLETDTMRIWEDAIQRVAAEAGFSPLGRLVKLEEVAQVIHFLCSRAAEGIVGQTIAVDGGVSISSISQISDGQPAKVEPRPS